ncbi:MAG TPA: uroporphyrinogen-III C-methyltransferase [Burkholderiaceae bacterium]|nr:uroporphyrinogen-III C-methyltransferase [Burkholderiaceae bacterium]
MALYAVLAALALLLAAQWWNSRAEIRGLRAEVASQLQAGNAIDTETKIMLKSVQDGMRELQAKVGVLESKQQESQSQQVALEQLYQEMSGNRDEWALSEIEQVLSTASQQLQLAGNIQGALIALQNADNRLARFDKPQFIAIRRAIARDQDRLKALPVADMAGIVLRLDSVITQIDDMPLLSDEKPAMPATPPKTSQRLRAKAASDAAKERKADLAAQSNWLATLNNKWQSWSSEMWNEVRQLIRIRSVETPEALLLSPTQSYYVRENLKLRLMNARLALLSRNEPAFRNDVVAAQDAITRYFDTRAKQTQVAQTILKQVQASHLTIEMPTLADSLNAVRNFKAKP